jgi:hypothetical protein
VQHVEGPGVRFELCWDHQGTSAQGGADIDLHVHKPGTTTDWFQSAGSTSTGRKCTGPNKDRCQRGEVCMSGFCYLPAINPDDCFFANCTAGQYFSTSPPNQYPGLQSPNWYGTPPAGTTPLINCSGSKYGALWTMLGWCHNPRLDIDNVLSVGVPENTNIDNPTNGQKFRAMVHYYGRGEYIPCALCSGIAGYSCDTASGNCYYTGTSPPQFLEGSAASTSAYAVHPIVNIYCGGNLKATYGAQPNRVNGFDWGVAANSGVMWRVADVTAAVSGGVTTDCTVTALHPPGTNAGYYVTSRNNTSRAY